MNFKKMAEEVQNKYFERGGGEHYNHIAIEEIASALASAEKKGREDEKPAKKDELAERLEKAGPKGTVDNITFYKAVADEAQKWAVEQVEKAFYDTDEQYDGVLLDEVLARLKEAK